MTTRGTSLLLGTSTTTKEVDILIYDAPNVK
jgi:hypothetical protein